MYDILIFLNEESTSFRLPVETVPAVQAYRKRSERTYEHWFPEATLEGICNIYFFNVLPHLLVLNSPFQTFMPTPSLFISFPTFYLGYFKMLL